MRISKHKNVFAKGYVPNWSEKVFVIKKIRYMYRGYMLLVILMVKKVLEHFTKKNCKKTNQTEFRVEKVIKSNNSFNSWIDKKL